MVISLSLFSGLGRYTLLLKGRSVGRNRRKSNVFGVQHQVATFWFHCFGSMLF